MKLSDARNRLWQMLLIAILLSLLYREALGGRRRRRRRRRSSYSSSSGSSSSGSSSSGSTSSGSSSSGSSSSGSSSSGSSSSGSSSSGSSSSGWPSCTPGSQCGDNGWCPTTGTCVCNEGYTGQLCSTKMTRCMMSSPCQNGGSCYNDERKRMCTCPVNFDGDFCETDISSCNPCGPKAIQCHQLSNHTGCECKFPYNGFDCSQNQMSRMKCPKRYGLSDDLRTVPDDNFEATSEVNENFDASQARLHNPSSAWCASPSDVERILTISLEGKTCILGYAIQGDPSADNFVTEFKIQRKLYAVSTSFDDIATEQVTFTGRNVVHERMFDEVIVARAVKFVVTAFQGDYACLRVELYGARCGNSDPGEAAEYFHHLGIKDENEFPEDKFSSSSFRSNTMKSFNARLDGDSAWCPSNADTDPRLVLKLPKMQLEVVGLVTQGLKIDSNHFYTRYYTVMVGATIYTAGSKNTSLGNFDGDTKTVQFLDDPIPLYDGQKTVRILLGNEDTGKCLRVELLACDRQEPCHSHPCLHGGTCQRTQGEESSCQCRTGFSGPTCEIAECHEKLDFLPGDVVVSSDKNNDAGSTTYRLDAPELWCTEQTDTENSVELNFTLVHNIYGFAIGGSTDTATEIFVKKFKFFFKLYYWQPWSPVLINGTEEFEGTMKTGQDRVDYFLDAPILASVVKFQILEYNDELNKCARVEVRGCSDTDFCATEIPCLNGASCHLEEREPVVCDCVPGFKEKFCGQNICDELNCHSNATCGQSSNFTCQCKPGFQGNGTFCEDICEVSNCHHNATCGKNTKYQCVCHEDFQGNGTFCEDRCIAAKCDDHAHCSNKTGYQCFCDYAYHGNGTYCYDLCVAANCDKNATCRLYDDIKFAKCSCDRGFGGNGTHCFDLCEAANCDKNATCHMYDDIKFANCSCDRGFGGNGTHCFDLCEAANCDDNATCHMYDDIKFANCSCDYGFLGNGTHCIDLCKEANCHENGHCVLRDEIKFANCSCDEGYRGNGTFCTAYYDWSPWTTCEKKCGVEFYNRTRECVDPEASFCIADETIQKRSCDLKPCAVHGNWTNWGDWGTCSATCGSGYSERTRDCANPPPQNGGDDCPGVGIEIGDCEAATLCPGEEHFGDWSNWSECNMTCDEGVQNRSRVCENEAAGCIGEPIQTKPCLLKYCPVNGSYTAWSNWTSCSTSCGPGQQLRHRNCTEPKPAYGGADCEGPGTETKECFIEVICPVDFGFSLWSSWSPCTTTCGDGLHWRARECEISGPDFCGGEKTQTDVCNIRPCPISGALTNWTDWSECDSECGSGQQEKTRSCSNPAPQHGGDDCPGETRRIQDCIMHDCPGDLSYTAWSSWSMCSVSCGSGVQTKTRYCLSSAGDGCAGPPQETKECLPPPCPVNGGFTEWSDWSICTVTCGSGTIQRTRECSNPEPANNGSDCFGLTVEAKECSMPITCQDELGFTVWSLWSACNVECSDGQIFRTRECIDPTLETCNGTYRQNNTCYAGPCPIHGGYSEWTPWSPCSGYCGSGLQSRTRTCSNPEPAFNGAGCAGSSAETQDCQHSSICSGESGYGEWSQWTLCTQTCGNSTQIRRRTCKEGAQPEECSDPSTQSKPCDKGQCPIHGDWCEWSVWSICSASCGSGSKSRHRTCTHPVPSYGGLPCFGNADAYDDCTMPLDCSGDDEFSEWWNWGACNVTCGEGTRQRSRYCKVVPTYPPAEDPYCTRPTEQYIPCYDEPCAVNGNFTLWTGWSACTASCGVGTRTRYRNCTNPPPLFDGNDCLGPLHQMKECENMPDCPDDGYFISWSDWAECSSDCEGVSYKTRECVADDSEKCVGLTNVTMECNTGLCPIDGSWSQWTPWSLCSKTCGEQEETRTRVCENQRNGGLYCSGHDIEVMPCNEYDYVPCPDPAPAQWSDWSWWTACTESCGGGHQRFRLCNNPPPVHGWPSCAGVKNETGECNTHFCPIHGGWSEWMSWTQCTLECGNGTRVRGKVCVNPRAQYGGQDCEGDPTEIQHCNVDPCPIDGELTLWSSWTYCNKPCGNGTSDRRRSCTNPTPMYGGRNCSGETLEWNECNTQPCISVDVVLDVTFMSVSWQEYLSDIVSFQTDVQTLIRSPYSSFPPGVSFLSCDRGTADKVRCSINVNYQSLADVELVLLQDKLLHPTTQTTLHSMTSENVMSSPLQARSTSPSSTSINVEWDALPSGAETAQTKALSGYIIFYKESTAESYSKIAVQPSLRTKTLENLKKFTQYKIVVCPYSENGNGVPSLPLECTTLEDVPSVPPEITNITSTSTSLEVTWTRIDDLYWHGVPRGYCVTYQARGSSQSDIQEIQDPSQLSANITSLKPYTRYYVQVAAKTGAGCGAQDRTSHVTMEDAPNGPPQNVSAESTGTKTVGILVKWDEVRPVERNGIILGYKVNYWTGTKPKETVNVPDSSAREIELSRLMFLTDYKMEVIAYTGAGDGPASAVVTATTDESTPAVGPVIVEAYNKSSTKIFLQWEVIDALDHRGVLLGYRIFYRPSDTKIKAEMIEISNPDILEYEFTDLFWWWWYEIRIAGYTRIGTGVTSNVTVQTDEEIPSRHPENIRGNALTTTSMLFEWDPILAGFAHGVILSYQLTVRETDDLSNVIINTTLAAYERSYYMEGLKKYTNYTMWVSASNSKGQGPIYEPGHINSTGEDGPEVPPDNIRVSTLEHISEIKLEWERIPPEYHNGILRGYYIEYTATVLAGEPVPTEKRVVQSKRIRGNRYATIMTNLDPGSTYEMKIFGYTKKNGTKSNVTVGATCRCPKYLRSSWWVLPPYTNISNPESPGGIFFMVARQILDVMCGTCPNGHGQTEFCHEEGCNKKRRRRRSTGNSYQKSSLQAVATNIDENVEVSFPVPGNRFMTTYGGVFPFISVVDAPGSAYFTVKNVPSTAEVVVTAALACLPMVLLMTMFSWMAGVVIWVLERNHNTEHFPDPFTKGVPEGFWWAYISMTTVGYGDRSPVTIPGRLFAIVWVLMGLVIISIVTGGIVTSITSILVIQEDKLYGAQVGAIENSAEYSKAVRQNADVVGFNNMEDIINAMHNKEIAGALLDMYAAATKKDSFDGGDIQLNRLIEYPTGYGFVLSGNMAKAAPLFREALATHKNKISEIVEGNTESIQLDRNEAEEAKEKSSGLFDPTSEAFTSSFKVTVSLLVTVIVAGLIWHFGRYRKNVKTLESLKEQIPSLRISEYLKTDAQDTVENFTTTLQKEIKSLREKHVRELRRLFEAQIQSHKATSTISVRQRRARVSPEVNVAMDYNETSDKRRKSFFPDFRKQRSVQIHPVES